MNNAVIAVLAIILGLGAWASTGDSGQPRALSATADSDQQVPKPIRITRVNTDPWIAIKNLGQQTRQMRG
jgi:TolA-binding protein